MDAISELGTDINSNWDFTNGDINLISNDSNLIQATNNRLNTRFNTLDFYYGYGSVLYKFLGWRRNDTTLRFIRIELLDVLKQDPRFTNPVVDLEYIKKGIQANIHNQYDDNSTFNMNFVISENGVILNE